MQATCSITLNHAFVLDEKAMQTLCQHLSKYIGPVKIRADCADDVSREFGDVAELLHFENPKAREVREIGISARAEHFSKHASVTLSNTAWRRISFQAEACDDVLTVLRSDIGDVIAGMRPWYAFLHRINFVAIAVIAYCVVFFGALAVIALRVVKVQDGAPSSSPEQALGVLMVIALMATGAGLNWLRDRFFPPAVFLIGQGVARFRTVERFQWGVVIAFFVSLGVAVLFALF